MARETFKIVLFLSEPKAGGQIQYRCPDGEDVFGTHTWEAPVRYLLRKYGAAGRCELLCLVTEKAEESYALLQKMPECAQYSVTPQKIPYQPDKDFYTGALKELLAHFKNPDCKLLLELTGGLRNTVMQLLLTSRVLSYQGVPTAGAVYAEGHWDKESGKITGGEIKDCSRLLQMFDLVAGLQEFTGFGSADTLRRYYDALAEITHQPTEQCIVDLLGAIRQLTDTIALCRTNQLERAQDEFQAALEQIKGSSDPFMQQLYSVFSRKYGKLNTPGVIRWCIKNRMLQQALTIYTERVPAYICRDGGGLLTMLPVRLQDENDYRDAYSAQFYSGFLQMSRNLPDPPKKEAPAGGSPPVTNKQFIVECQIQTIERLEECLKANSDFYRVTSKGSPEKLRAVMKDYLYIKALRNMVCHANDEATPEQECLMKYLQHEGYPPLEDPLIEDVQNILAEALRHLN